MTKKEINDFWRISLILYSGITIIYLLMFSGHFPYIDKITFSQEIDPGHTALSIIKFPYAIPRILDLVLIFILVGTIIRLWQYVNREFKNKPETEQKRNDPEVAIAIGLITGLIIGFIGGLIALYTNALFLGVTILVLCGILVSFVGSFSGTKFGLLLNLSYSLISCFLFGLLELNNLSISLSIIIGLIIMSFSCPGIIFTSTIRFIFTRFT